MSEEKRLFTNSASLLKINEDAAESYYNDYIEKQGLASNSGSKNTNSDQSYSKGAQSFDVYTKDHPRVTLEHIRDIYLSNMSVQENTLAVINCIKSLIEEKFLYNENGKTDFFKLKPKDLFKGEAEKKEYVICQQMLCLILYFLGRGIDASKLFLSLDDENQELFYSILDKFFDDKEAGISLANQEKIKFSNIILNFEVKNTNALYYKWNSHINLEQYNDAIGPLKRYLDLRPYSDNAWSNLSHCYKRLMLYEDAIDSARCSINIFSENRSALFSLGYCLMMRGRFIEAREAFSAFQKYYPDEEGYSKKWLIALDFICGDKDEALWKLNNLEEADKRKAFEMALAQAKRHAKYRLAIEILWYLCEIDVANDSYHLDRSNMYQQIGEFDDAAKEYKSYIDLLKRTEPSKISHDNLEEMAKRYKRAAKFQEAINVLEEISEISECCKRARIHLFGLYYMTKGKDFAFNYLDQISNASNNTKLKNICLEEFLIDVIRLEKYNSLSPCDVDEAADILLINNKNDHLALLAKLLLNLQKGDKKLSKLSLSKLERAIDGNISFDQVFINLIVQIYPGFPDLDSLDRIIYVLKDKSTPKFLNLFKAAKVRILWKSDFNKALNYYFKNPDIKGLVLKIIPKIKNHAFSVLFSLLNENRKYPRSNSNYRDIKEDFVLEEGNKIVSLFDLHEFANTVASGDVIKDISDNVSENTNIILVPRDLVPRDLVPRTQTPQSDGDTLVATSKCGPSRNDIFKNDVSRYDILKYDILYYTISGTKKILDYTRSFIGEDIAESSSNLPENIRNNYKAYALNNKKKKGEIPEPIKISTEIKKHNHTIIDDYAWMKMKHLYKDMYNQYMDLEAKYADDYFENSKSGIDYLEEELKSQMNHELYTKIASVAGFDYYKVELRNKGLPIYYRVKQGRKLDITEAQVVLDFNKLRAEKDFAYHSEVFISQEHNLLAYGIDYTGDESYKVRIIDLKTYEYLEDVLYNARVDFCVYEPYEIMWHKKIKGLAYYDCSKHKVRLHKIGDAQEDDLSIEIDNRGRCGLYTSSNGEFAIISQNHQIKNNAKYLISLKDENFAAKLIIKDIRKNKNKQEDQDSKEDQEHFNSQNNQSYHYLIDQAGDYIYARINDVSNNFRIIRTELGDLNDFDYKLANWEEFIPADANRSIDTFCVSKNYLVINYIVINSLAMASARHPTSEIEVIRIKDKKSKKIQFSKEAFNAKGFVEDFENDKIGVYYSSFLDNRILYSYDFDKNEVLLKYRLGPQNIKREDYVLERVFAGNKGTKVPITLFYKKSLFKNDGSNPLYLFGYGSYGISSNWREYSPNLLSLIDRGFVYAAAHIRGGGELGLDWWNGARELNQKNRFLDFISVAEFLIKKNYTKKGNIVAAGTSSGGALVTIAANMRPDLFKTIIPANPCTSKLDPMYFEHKNNVHIYELGDPDKKDIFENILQFCPYNNIKQGPYPSVYIRHGMDDMRLPYYESLKFVQKLRDHRTNQSKVILRIRKKIGHFYPYDKFEWIKEYAEQFTFIFKEFGIKVAEESLFQTKQESAFKLEQPSLEQTRLEQFQLERTRLIPPSFPQSTLKKSHESKITINKGASSDLKSKIKCSYSSGRLDQIYKIFDNHTIESLGKENRFMKSSEEPICFEIEEEGKLKAALLAEPWWGKFHIRYLVVEKDYRGQGIGSSLLEHAIEHAKVKGYKEVLLESYNFNTPEFYKKHGFEVNYINTGLERDTSFYHMSRRI